MENIKPIWSLCRSGHIIIHYVALWEYFFACEFLYFCHITETSQLWFNTGKSFWLECLENSLNHCPWRRICSVKSLISIGRFLGCFLSALFERLMNLRKTLCVLWNTEQKRSESNITSWRAFPLSIVTNSLDLLTSYYQIWFMRFTPNWSNWCRNKNLSACLFVSHILSVLLFNTDSYEWVIWTSSFKRFVQEHWFIQVQYKWLHE